MIQLKQLLRELSQTDTNIANLTALNVETIEDLSFTFKSKSIAKPKGVFIHDIITIDAFDVLDRENIQFQPYHLIFGENSMAIFDAFGIDETAGLTRKECQKHLDDLAKEGKTETWDGAYIAGLTNWAGSELYCFYNVGRLLYPGYPNRVLPHESLHLTRDLITINDNDYIRQNQGKGEWWEDSRAKWTPLDDENEEYFAETLERCNAIAYSRWNKAKNMMEIPPKTNTDVISFTMK